MKIEKLNILNFRGIREVNLSELGSMVIIAGQNGSGKSCVFDAIRLLKSVYGGYQANEWQQWMGEFQISLTNRSSDFVSMFNDKSRELRISCEFRLAEAERNYIISHADELLREKIWRTILPEAYSWGGYRMAMFAAQFREHEPEVATRAKLEYENLMQELAASTIKGEFFIPPGGTPQINNSLTLSVIFSTFRPTEIGVIDYHGAQRHYGREVVQGINLNLEVNEQQRSQSALYNSAAKYNNVKSEMAASYIKELLAEKAAGATNLNQTTLTTTLQELFTTFFPEKKFLGPQATLTGALSFPVVTSSGAQHDLDELSAGEKEILYGYLRIRNSAPKFSIILLDEPELHLNPRLIRGLPQFYKKNLGEALNNQIWLVSHSDALLREVVGRDGYNVFHMLPSGKTNKGESQLKPLSVTADLDLAIVDLVGDLAAYRPNGKVIIFEGGGDSDFDQRITSTLFPEILEQANLVSGNNKMRVRALHETLDAASKKGQLPFKFFAITDKDSESMQTKSMNIFSWDVYHIENYFLEPKFIAMVLSALQISTHLSEENIKNELRQCAQDSMPQLIRHELAEYANRALVESINTSTDPKSQNLSKALFEAVTRSVNKIQTAYEGILSKEKLEILESNAKTRYTESIADGTWVSKFRGRDILKNFASKHVTSVTYEVFRNLIISKMKDASHQPAGMKIIIEIILSS